MQSSEVPLSFKLTRTVGFWVRCKWPTVELQDKTVQFLFYGPQSEIEGYGIFRVTETYGTDLRRIDIVITTAPSTWERLDQVIHLKQAHADGIAPHPQQIEAPFLLRYREP